VKALLTGNEAVARGAWEAGVRVVTAYPGTPSTEITENAVKYKEIKAEWSPNEKVALEVAFGASLGGARALTAMKHVGVNIAADPLLTISYTGVNGGLVLVSADDPGMHSSQNEQDNRYYALLAKLPLLEPADSQEALDFTKEAFAISEEFDTPVILRLTTRISHSQSPVNLGERKEVALKDYLKDPSKYVMLPANGKKRRPLVEKRLLALEEYSEHTPLNRIEKGEGTKGVITSGVSYQYVKEIVPSWPVLKLGFTHPLPRKLIEEFVSSLEEVYVVEELDPFLEEGLKALGIKVKGKDISFREGELDASRVAGILGVEEAAENKEELSFPIPARPPLFCAGCPHRGVFYVLNKLKLTVLGDIGCYTLGATKPFGAMDACISMGASIGMAFGFEKARGKEGIVAIIGDSTFLHSGMTGLLDVVYNKGNVTTIILDNRTTAMTGHQDHPGTGHLLNKEEAKEVDLLSLIKALGVERVFEADPYELDALTQILKRETKIEEPTVIIARRACVLLPQAKTEKAYTVDPQKCNACGLCQRLGCPALIVQEEGKAVIDEKECTGCGLCAQVCRGRKAISRAGETFDKSY